MGMKPDEHEYKVMGMAPYAKPAVYQRAYEVFRNTMFVDGLDFKFHERPPDMYFHFRDRLEGARFDGIAGGLQKYTEELLAEWTRNAIRETGIGRVVFAGGVAMNIKAIKEISHLPEVETLFVPPSPGDESLAMGCCYHLCASAYDTTPAPLPTAYLGPDVDQADIERVVAQARSGGAGYTVHEATAREVARRLASGRVIGRCAGRMEFGARALGNRSILADPRSHLMIRTINEKIKNRDFWMPFAPIMLKDSAHRYIENPKRLPTPFMTVAFDATSQGWPKMMAAIHPADHTARPQFVDASTNPGVTEILQEFEKLTGESVLLNTSFNLHGEPIVGGASDAYRVFGLTDIDDLVVGQVLISKPVSGAD